MVKKVSRLNPWKIRHCTHRDGNLTPFQVFSFCTYTLLSLFLLVLKATLKESSWIVISGSHGGECEDDCVLGEYETTHCNIPENSHLHNVR
jgi:hypothetical protein